MADRDAEELVGGASVNRRGLLKCMTWAGTGVVWTLSGGVAPHARPDRRGCGRRTPQSELLLCRSAHSHIGFHLPPNPDPRATLSEAYRE